MKHAQSKQNSDAPKISDAYSTIRLHQKDISALVAFIELLQDVPKQQFRQLILYAELFDPLSVTK